MKDIKLIEGFKNYYIGKNGIVYKEILKDNELIYKPLKQYYTTTGVATTTLEGKAIRDIAELVYKTFTQIEIEYNDIVFLDGDKKNCNLNNLITVSELVEFYKNNN